MKNPTGWVWNGPWQGMKWINKLPLAGNEKCNEEGMKCPRARNEMIKNHTWQAMKNPTGWVTNGPGQGMKWINKSHLAGNEKCNEVAMKCPRARNEMIKNRTWQAMKNAKRRVWNNPGQAMKWMKNCTWQAMRNPTRWIWNGLGQGMKWIKNHTWQAMKNPTGWVWNISFHNTLGRK